MFHEMTLKLYFMKCSERKISQRIPPLSKTILHVTILHARNMNKSIIADLVRLTAWVRAVELSRTRCRLIDPHLHIISLPAENFDKCSHPLALCHYFFIMSDKYLQELLEEKDLLDANIFIHSIRLIEDGKLYICSQFRDPFLIFVF